jgi:hypothetical protein
MNQQSLFQPVPAPTATTAGDEGLRLLGGVDHLGEQEQLTPHTAAVRRRAQRPGAAH